MGVANLAQEWVALAEKRRRRRQDPRDDERKCAKAMLCCLNPLARLLGAQGR